MAKIHERQETQASVFQWGEETFGTGRDLAKLTARTNTEMAELMQEAVSHGNTPKFRLECADVLVMLYTLAGIAGFDLLDALDDKMVVNRGRKWKMLGDGTGQHE